MKESRVANDLDQQFMQGMDDISIATESDFDDLVSDNQHEQLEQEQRRIALERNKLILQELKNGVNMDNALINEFEHDFNGIVEVTRGHKDHLISPQLVEEIKKKVSNAAPQIVLAEEILLATPSVKATENKKPTTVTSIVERVPDSREQSRLRQKMEKMFQERELIEMARCDAESMKYERDFHSELLGIRFFAPLFKTVSSSKPPVFVASPEPAYTFTNLRPQLSNESNVLSKHSKILAFRALSGTVKPRLMPCRSEQQEVEFRTAGSSVGPEHNEQLLRPLQVSFARNDGILSSLRDHYELMADVIAKLEQVSLKYKPRLLKQHLADDEKGLNADIYDEGAGGKDVSLERFIETMEAPDRIKEVRITFEKLGDLKGASQLRGLEYASLQYNSLRDIDQLQSNSRLIEVNLSNNHITRYDALSQLRWLRYVDLEHNRIAEMAPLAAESLEVLLLKGNLIREIGGLELARNLRRLDLSSNSLQRICGLENLCFLDEINLARNQLTELRGVDRCLLLRRLDVSHNRLRSIDRLVLMFLNELDLRSNQLEQVSSMVMPSLQTLYLSDNRLVALEAEASIYMPSLRLLNIDRNRLTGYAPVWQLLKHSAKLSIVKYDDNEELSLLPDKARQLYEHMLYRRRHQLAILNQSQFSIGLKRYYESLYEQLLEGATSASQPACIFSIEAKIQLTLLESFVLSRLETAKDPFSRQAEFVWLKSVKVADNLLQIQRGIVTGQQLNAQDSVFHRLDCFRLRYRRALHKIHSLLLRWKYRRAKRQKHFLRSRSLIERHLSQLSRELHRMELRWVIGKFQKKATMGVGNEQAIKIQKVWRGYALRKKYRLLMGRIRMPSSQDDYLEGEIDLDFFQNPIDFNFQLKVPENFNFGQLVIRPEVFRKAEERLPEISKARLPHLHGNMLAESATSEQSVSSQQQLRRGAVALPPINRAANQQELPPVRRKQEEQHRIMEEWGFKNPETVQMMQKKAEKKRKARQKELEKNMTAAQRYERFKKS